MLGLQTGLFYGNNTTTTCMVPDICSHVARWMSTFPLRSDWPSNAAVNTASTSVAFRVCHIRLGSLRSRTMKTSGTVIKRFQGQRHSLRIAQVLTLEGRRLKSNNGTTSGRIQVRVPERRSNADVLPQLCRQPAPKTLPKHRCSPSPTVACLMLQRRPSTPSSK